MNENLNFGGYPGVIMAGTDRDKFDANNEICSSYLEKDIQPVII
ncbi:MAG: hypothetical protein WCI71_11485 [Bacteroidota bacterium]